MHLALGFHGCYGPVQYHLRSAASRKYYRYETMQVPSQELFNLESLQTRNTRNICTMVLHFLLASEYLKATFFLILRTILLESKKVTINTWAWIDLISWKHCCFYTFYKQKISNNRLTRNTLLSILHFLIAVYTNYCLPFVEMFKIQFSYLKCIIKVV